MSTVYGVTCFGRKMCTNRLICLKKDGAVWQWPWSQKCCGRLAETLVQKFVCWGNAEACAQMGKVCNSAGRQYWKIKKRNKHLSALEIFIPKNSPYLLNDPGIFDSYYYFHAFLKRRFWICFADFLVFRDINEQNLIWYLDKLCVICYKTITIF